MNFLKPTNNILVNIEFKSVPMVRFFYTLIFISIGYNTCAQASVIKQKELNDYTEIVDSNNISILDLNTVTKKDLLISSICTGLVGGHRLLLNKKASTAIIYCATLGGGLGFLPVLDFFTILFTKKENLDELKHNNFFLFNKEE